MAAQASEPISNHTCQICNEHPASHYCDCSKPYVFFCLNCCDAHDAKFPRIIHWHIPIAALSRRNPEEYKHKNKSLMRAAVELRKNIEQLEKCCREFDDLIQNCISYLTNYRAWWRQELQAEKEILQAAIDIAIEETTNCLDKGLEPVSSLALAMWELPPDELQMFSYEISAPDLETLCKSWASYQNNLEGLCENFPEKQVKNKLVQSSDAQRDAFAAILGNKVEIYDLRTQQSTHHTLSVDFGWGGSYVALDGHTLLCMGVPSTSVYELDLSSLKLTTLPPLWIPRGEGGAAKTLQFVYIFGGDAPGYKSCEKYAIEHKQWLPLGSMAHPRFHFTPCVFRTLIYLPCLRTTPIIEAFNPETEDFTELAVTLPAQMKLHFASVAFVTGGELCILSGGLQMGRWKTESENEFRLFDTNRMCWSSQPPLIVDSVALVANGFNGRVEKFGLKSYSFI